MTNDEDIEQAVEEHWASLQVYIDLVSSAREAQAALDRLDAEYGPLTDQVTHDSD